MLLDLTLELDPRKLTIGDDMLKPHMESGHLGTHFDVVDKKFPLESFRTRGKLVDISHIRDREVEISDLDGHVIEEGDMVIFHTGYLDELTYASRLYAHRSAELSDETVRFLVDRKIRLIGVDATGVQKPKKHVAVDRFCADRGVFIVENLSNVGKLKALSPKSFTVFTLPLNRPDLSGLPCRVIAEIDA